MLDLGGVAATWEAAPVRPREVVAVNLGAGHAVDLGWFRGVAGDACDPPPGVLDEPFDLVFSNSLLEHVGGHARRRELAAVVERAAPRHWVQTPYRYFPVEPHWMVPGMQFLPVAARAKLSRRLPFGPANKHTPEPDVVDECCWVELVGVTELRHYFPRSEIWRERAFGLTKSIVAVRA